MVWRGEAVPDRHGGHRKDGGSRKVLARQSRLDMPYVINYIRNATGSVTALPEPEKRGLYE